MDSVLDPGIWDTKSLLLFMIIDIPRARNFMCSGSINVYFSPCMDGGWGMLRICLLAVSYSGIPIASGVARSPRQGRRESAPKFKNIHQFVRLEPSVIFLLRVHRAAEGGDSVQLLTVTLAIRDGNVFKGFQCRLVHVLSLHGCGSTVVPVIIASH